MCTNSRLVYNRYINRCVRVDCGHCVSCQQAKANKRAQRIRHNVSLGTTALSVTLTYKNDFIPYIDTSEVAEDSFVLVHRDNSIHYANNHCGGSSLHVSTGRTDLVELDADFRPALLHSVHLLRYTSNRIGVACYEDVQKFIKRLRINLKRIYNYDKKFSYYACTEYGRRSHRPHAHVLIFCPSTEETSFRGAIAKSWSFDDKSSLPRFCETAKNMASYLSGYVTKSAGSPDFFKTGRFRQKHSYSRGFGTMLHAFSLGQILQKIDNRDLSYVGKKIGYGGVPENVNLPIPEYVVNRYFPRFKGYSRIAPAEVYNILCRPQKLSAFSRQLDYQFGEIHSICTRLDNAFLRFHEQSGLSRYDFADYYIRAWRVHSMNVLKRFYTDLSDERDWSQRYDNIDDFYVNPSISPNLRDYFSSHPCSGVSNPNHFRLRQQKTLELTSLSFKQEHQRLVTNQVMANGLNINV